MAKRLVASSIDPSTLVLKLIGEDYVDPAVVNNIKRLEWGDSIFGIYLALNEPLEYKSGNDIGKSAQLHISDVTLDYISKIFYECRSGKLPNSPLPCGVPLPYQSSWMRPIPQLSNYKIPSLTNIYLCGSGNHPGAGVSMAPGRNASQVILADLGLDFNQIIHS